MGVVNIVKCGPNELVHGKQLLTDEKKVLVKEVYPNAVSEVDDMEEEEFMTGAFLRANKVFLRKLSFRRTSKSKKREEVINQLSPLRNGPRKKENN